jgi:hypothetical protein
MSLMTINMNISFIWNVTISYLFVCVRQKVFSLLKDNRKKSISVNKTTCVSSDDIILDSYRSALG